jgi:branched-chain amino acid transport system ATP-binding protein
VTAPLLETRGLRVKYGNVEALHGIDIAVRQGEIVSILGANGAGKSTTLRAISGLLRPSGGEIRYDGKPAGGIPAHERVRLGIAQAPEGRRIFGTLTVRENLGLGAFTRNDAAEIAETAAWIYRLFPILEKRRDQQPATLNGGEQQTIREINQTTGVTVVLVEQNARAALKLAHRGYVMEVGRVVLEGHAQALIEDPTVQNAYLGGRAR